MSDASCKCREEMDAELEPFNAELLANLFGPFRAFVAVTKKTEKGRKKPPLVQATFCPFCGLKYTGGQHQ